MTIDRSLFKAEFTAHWLPRWPCPSCISGRLELVPGTLHEGQTAESKRGFDHPAWEPEFIDGRFSCLFECPECRNAVSAAGRYRVQDDRHYDEHSGESGDYESYYRPEYFSESPPIISVPSKVPGKIGCEIRESFKHYWGDRMSCANRIRSGVEQLLSFQRIPRTSGKTKGKGRRFLSLHERIERFGKSRPELAAKLMAIKWVGNAGSHANAITPDDLLDGYDLLAFVLDEIYSGRKRRVDALTKSINRRRAPRSPRR